MEHIIDYMSMIDADRMNKYKISVSQLKKNIEEQLETETMNIRKISRAIHEAPKDEVEHLNDWVNQNEDLSTEEKRVIISVATSLNFRDEGGLILDNDYLESNLRTREKESSSKYCERAASILIEAYMSSNYRGFLKHLIISSLTYYRREGYKPEIAESDGEILDSLTQSAIKAGDIYYKITSPLGDHIQLQETSLMALDRMDRVIKSVWRSDYFYRR